MVVWPQLEQIGERTPLFGDTGFDRRHRHLGEAAGDEGRKDHAERPSANVVGAAGKQEPDVAADGLHPGRKTRIWRLKGEPVDALDVLRLCTEAPGEGQKIPLIATGVDAPPDTSCSPHSQRRR